MTPMEQKLARRIHAQRARLRQLEKMATSTSDERWRRWMEIALRLGRALKEMQTGKPRD